MPHRLVTVLLACLFVATPAWGWSWKEHALMTRMSVQRLLKDDDAPAGLRDWLREHCPEAQGFNAVEYITGMHLTRDLEGVSGLSYWSIHPDVDRTPRVEAFNTTERLMHYLDLEFIHPDPDKRVYFHDLSALPDLDDVPRDPDHPGYVEGGYLPFRVEQCYDELVRAWRDGDDDNAVRWAGYLAHYLQDNTQPHHATADFRSHSYFDSLPQGRRPSAHGWFEGGFVSDGQPARHPDLRSELAALIVEPLEPFGTFEDPWAASVAMSREAYVFLPLIGEAAAAGYRAFHEAGEDSPATRPAGGGRVEEVDFQVFARYRQEEGGPSVLEVKADRTRRAVVIFEAALRQAWAEAEDGDRPESLRTPGLRDRPVTPPAGDPR